MVKGLSDNHVTTVTTEPRDEFEDNFSFCIFDSGLYHTVRHLLYVMLKTCCVYFSLTSHIRLVKRVIQDSTNKVCFPAAGKIQIFFCFLNLVMLNYVSMQF